MSLALGTVQFGQNYGIANKRGQPTFEETKSILMTARASGMHLLDTAIAYGDSERRLGEIGIQDWQVVSKLPAVPETCGDVSRWVAEAIEGSLRRLNINCLYGLLLHRPEQLLEKNGGEIYAALQKCKQDGLVRKIGVSIYDPMEHDAICDGFRLDLVQAPFNLLDHRLIDSGRLKRFREQDTELHVRSVFLQGLLLMNSGDRPKKFDRWAPLWTLYQSWLEQAHLTPMQACLEYALSFSEISQVVVGVDSLAQLHEILQFAKGGVPEMPPQMRCMDADLINPARWSHI